MLCLLVLSPCFLLARLETVTEGSVLTSSLSNGNGNAASRGNNFGSVKQHTSHDLGHSNARLLFSGLARPCSSSLVFVSLCLVFFHCHCLIVSCLCILVFDKRQKTEGLRLGLGLGLALGLGLGLGFGFGNKTKAKTKTKDRSLCVVLVSFVRCPFLFCIRPLFIVLFPCPNPSPNSTPPLTLTLIPTLNLTLTLTLTLIVTLTLTPILTPQKNRCCNRPSSSKRR